VVEDISLFNGSNGNRKEGECSLPSERHNCKTEGTMTSISMLDLPVIDIEDLSTSCWQSTCPHRGMGNIN
jgi:hypothetical protein